MRSSAGEVVEVVDPNTPAGMLGIRARHVRDIARSPVGEYEVVGCVVGEGDDVAFLLVDGQRLLDNAGEEERYLKSLLGSYRTGLARLEDQLLDDGKPLIKCPRIWVLALSKADLLSELDVFGFRDLVIEKASDDLSELRKVLEGFVDSPAALSVGEDFVRFSSARFEPDKIEVTERIGLDLILPLAAMLPFERHLKWIEQKRVGSKVLDDLTGGVVELAAVMSKLKIPGAWGRVAKVASRVLRTVSELGSEQLTKMNSDAIARKDHMTAVLTRFGLDLDEAEERRVLLRSKK